MAPILWQKQQLYIARRLIKAKLKLKFKNKLMKNTAEQFETDLNTTLCYASTVFTLTYIYIFK